MYELLLPPQGLTKQYNYSYYIFTLLYILYILLLILKYLIYIVLLLMNYYNNYYLHYYIIIVILYFPYICARSLNILVNKWKLKTGIGIEFELNVIHSSFKHYTFRVT